MKTILQHLPRQVGTGRNNSPLSPNYVVTGSQNPQAKTFAAPASRAGPP